MAGIGTALSLQDADRILACSAGLVKPAFDGGEGEVYGFMADRMLPGLGGEFVDLGLELALCRWCGEQRADDGKTQSVPSVRWTRVWSLD